MKKYIIAATSRRTNDALFLEQAASSAREAIVLAKVSFRQRGWYASHWKFTVMQEG